MVERADCETLVRQRFSTTLAQLESSRPRYDGVCARAALDRVSQAACSERIDTIVPYETQAQCGGGCRVFDVEDTPSCNNTGLCPQGFVCAYGASYSCVPCQVPGDLCIYGSCGALLLCNQNTNRCEEPPDVGAPCPRGLCKSGACVSGTCTPLLALGKACNSSSQCQSGYCPRGACDTLPGLGAPCPANRCDAGLRCDTAQQPEPEPRCVTDTVTACQLPYNF